MTKINFNVKKKLEKIEDSSVIKDELTNMLERSTDTLRKTVMDFQDDLEERVDNKLYKMKVDNLTIPGKVGSGCEFKSVSEYIAKEFQRLQTLIDSTNKKGQETLEDRLELINQGIER